MCFDRYRHKYKGFYEKFSFSKSISKGECPYEPCGKLSPPPPFMVMSVLEEIQSSNDYMDIARG